MYSLYLYCYEVHLFKTIIQTYLIAHILFKYVS